MARAPISPCDCTHFRTRLIQSSDGGPPAYHERVTVCPDCGEFAVSIRTHRESHRVTFTLSTPESVAAAGRYLQYLESEARP